MEEGIKINMGMNKRKGKKKKKNLLLVWEIIKRKIEIWIKEISEKDLCLISLIKWLNSYLLFIIKNTNSLVRWN
jgi:hypothetical protein